MQKHLINNGSTNLIIFFAGWGCDSNQFTNLKDQEDILILYDYQDLTLNFDFTKYQKITLIAYSAGVFIASILQDKLPPLTKKIAICGNPFLFDPKWGLKEETVKLFKDINLDNYLNFRRQYMVENDKEYEKYNQLQSLRSIESCQKELESLQNLYLQHKKDINPEFDIAIMAEHDDFFNLPAQKIFYKDKIRTIPNSKHHIFFNFTSFQEIAEIS